MADPSTPDPVAMAVRRSRAEEHHGALLLRGYLEVPPLRKGAVRQGSDVRRLYVEDSFRIWLEFTSNDILHHIPGTGEDPCCLMGAVWIKREAPIRKVETGFAYVIAEAMMLDDDPAGGPRPPYSGPRPPYSGPRPPY